MHCVRGRFIDRLSVLLLSSLDRSHQVLMDMFYQGESSNSMAPSPLPPTPRASLSYEEVVKELIHDEKQYQRDLHMIIRVFREELVKIVKDPKVSGWSVFFSPTAEGSKKEQLGKLFCCTFHRSWI